MDVEVAFVDTNVLLEATTPARRLHAAARRVLSAWPAAGTRLYLSGQVVREYLVVATRPEDQNGLGLTVAAALHNVDALLARTRLLDESSQVTDRLRALVAQRACSGKQIHDANVVATMAVHGIEALVTANVRHFERFTGALRLIDLASLAPGPR